MKTNLNFFIEKVIDHNKSIAGYFVTFNNDVIANNNMMNITSEMGKMMNQMDKIMNKIFTDANGEYWKRSQPNDGPGKMFFKTEAEMVKFINETILQF